MAVDAEIAQKTVFSLNFADSTQILVHLYGFSLQIFANCILLVAQNSSRDPDMNASKARKQHISSSEGKICPQISFHFLLIAASVTLMH